MHPSRARNWSTALSTKRSSRHLAPASLDHFVSTCDESRGNLNAESARCFEVEDQAERRWLLDGQVGSPGSVSDALQIACGPMDQVATDPAVGHEASRESQLLVARHGRQPQSSG